MYKLAEAVAEGARQVEGNEVVIKRVPETLPKELLDKIGATEAQKAFDHIPVAKPDELDQYDAIIIGTPTRYGNVCGQIQAFLDSTGALWAEGKLIGKVGGGFVSTATQHGGQETTLRALHTELLHQGMVIVRPALRLAGPDGSPRSNGRHALRRQHRGRRPGRAATQRK